MSKESKEAEEDEGLPPGWKVPKPKPPWGYRKTPPSITGPSPDYTAEAEVHREELKSQEKMTEQKPEEPSPTVIDYEALYRRHVLHETDQIPVGSTAYKVEEAKRRVREYTPKKWSLVWGIVEAIKREEKFFEGLRVKGEVYSGRALGEAEKAKKQGKDVLAGAKYAEALAITGGKSIIGFSSAAVRPKVWVQTPGAVVDLLAYPEKRKLVKQQIVGDPARAIMGFSGSLLGASLASSALSKIETMIRGEKVTSVPYTRTVKTREGGFIRLTGKRAIESKAKGGIGRADIPPTYIKLNGEWFRTGEGLIQASEGMDPWMTLQTVDNVFVLKDVKPPFGLDYTRLGGSRSSIGTKTVTTLLQRTGPRSSQLGYLGLLGGIKSEKDLLDRMEKDIITPKSEGLLWDRPTPDIPGYKTKTREITEPIIEPDISTRTGFLPIQEPILDEPTRQRTFEKQLPKFQPPILKTTLLPPPPSIQRKKRTTRIPRFEDPLKLKKRKVRSKSPFGVLKINPIQEDPLKSVSKLEKDLFGPKKKRKKKKR